MKKIEQVFREILYQALEKNVKRLTQLELSRKLHLSLSTVNLAVQKCVRCGALKGEARSFKVIDTKKILYLWASMRTLQRDVLYQTHIDLPVREIERALPDVAYAAYTAYKLRFHDVPADYSEVYAYAENKELEEIQKRFPANKKNSNLFILKKDENMRHYSKTGTLAQLFVDFWNLPQWYASDFLHALEKKLNLASS